MSNPVKVDSKRAGAPKLRRRGSSVLGLTLDGSQLEGIVLRRTNGSVQVGQTFSITLSLDPLTNDAELVGREIRNHLAAAGVKERNCVMGLPLKWALTANTKMPEMAEADVAGFLDLEAERGFPCDVSTLMVAVSRSQLGSGERHATLVGVPRNQASALEKVLRTAQLKPLSFSLGLTALQPPKSAASEGVLALMISNSYVGLQVTCGGGITALRTLEGALETEPNQKRLHTDVLTREIRITLAQLPAEARAAVRQIRIYGPRDLAQQLADEIDLRLEALDLQVEVVTHYSEQEFGVQVPSGVAVSPAFSLAAGYLAGRAVPLDFLPPRVTAWQQFSARYSSGRLQQAGVAAAALSMIVAGAFLYQQCQLWWLRSQLTKVQGTVRTLETMSAKINQFRPWFDPTMRGLRILSQLTDAFPEDGSVTAKSVEMRDLATVTCTGVARDYASLHKTLARLRQAPQIPEVNLGQTRGQPPTIQFSFSFAWSEGGPSAN